MSLRALKRTTCALCSDWAFDVRLSLNSSAKADIAGGLGRAKGLNRSRGRALWQRQGFHDSALGRPVLKMRG